VLEYWSFGFQINPVFHYSTVPFFQAILILEKYKRGTAVGEADKVPKRLVKG
jgi:hypothetical protein